MQRAGRERGEQEKKVTAALRAFVAFLELLLIAMETRHRYQKVWQGGEVWQGDSDTIQSARDAHRSQLLGSSEKGSLCYTEK